MKKCLALIVTVALSSVALAQPAIDGSAHDSYYGPLPLAYQDTTTGFGDASLGRPDVCNGSELDTAYGTIYNGVLYLVLAGNLETNGNKLEIFFDTRAGGQHRLLATNPGTPNVGLLRMGEDPNDPNMPGFTFQTGFEADYWVAVNCSGNPVGLFVDYAELYVDAGNPGVLHYCGAGQAKCATAGGALTGGDTGAPVILATVDNSNIAGVGGDGGNNDGSGVKTGIELAIPLAALGNPTGDIKITAFINGQQHDWVSNQFLGGLFGSANLIEPRQVNLEGSWQEPFTIANPSPIYGACCYGQACAITTQANCSGAWQGAYTTCDTNPCSGPALGQCCLANSYGGLCMYVKQVDCLEFGGVFTAGLDCSNCACVPAVNGACCLADNTCVANQSQAACTALGGLYVGDYTSCTSNPCTPGACCEADVCSIKQKFACQAIQFAKYLGEGTTCDGSPCAVATILNPHVAGSMQGWDPNATPMTETAPGSGVWTHQFTGLAASTRFEFKITDGSWANNLPGANSWCYSDATGQVTITYDANFHFDGWAPNRDRLGVDTTSPTTPPWTAVGSFLSEIGGSDWDNASPQGAMTAQGAGVYKLTFTNVPAGNYAWKAVRTGSWDSISWDTRSVGTADMAFTIGAATDTVTLWVDEPHGCVKVDVVAAPPVTGACCVAGVCSVLTPAACATASGEYKGDNTACTPNPCVQPLCAGDGNCDRQINWRDIDFLIAAQNDNVSSWTALFAGSPPCQFLNLDTSGDSHVNWRDIDPFIALMNTTCP